MQLSNSHSQTSKNQAAAQLQTQIKAARAKTESHEGKLNRSLQKCDEF